MRIAFDLDNTLCDARWREPLIEREGWEAYDAECTRDQPIKVTQAMAQAFYTHGHYLVGITERHARMEQQTRRWLSGMRCPIHRLIMRPPDNFMPAPELKVMQLQEYIDTKILDLVIDDSDKVLEAFRALKIPTLHFMW